MIIFEDKISGDEMLSDSYKMEEVHDGFFYEVKGKWVVAGDVEVDIGANPSAEGGEDETVDPTQRRVVDVVDGFRLQETGYDKKAFMAYVKPWLAAIAADLPEDKVAEFKAKAQPAIKFLVSKIKDLQFFTGESMNADGTMCYAYYPEGSGDPTFLFPVYAMNERKC
ncbi:hypothetical protein BSKO_01071 [Bryopsis sp. KO-2023]|nr:hypothetical protein BSKO_01071 [Bryopsis sp. KO-2023]